MTENSKNFLKFFLDNSPLSIYTIPRERRDSMEYDFTVQPKGFREQTFTVCQTDDGLEGYITIKTPLTPTSGALPEGATPAELTPVVAQAQEGIPGLIPPVTGSPSSQELLMIDYLSECLAYLVGCPHRSAADCHACVIRDAKDCTRSHIAQEVCWRVLARKHVEDDQ